MILASLALSLSLQSAGETVTAVRNDDPETWVVEYPRVIRPFVVQYRQCLNVANRTVDGEATFQAQHRTDIPRCAKVFDQSVKSANEAMAQSKTRISPDEVDRVFRSVGAIHIARGRDLDDQFRRRMAATLEAREQYEENKPKGLVLELRDGSVVKARTDATAPAQSGGVE